MKDYNDLKNIINSEMNNQLGGLNDEIKRQRDERKKDYTLTQRTANYFSKNQTGVKTLSAGGIGFVAGALLPLVSAPGAALAGMCIYAGKKFVYDPIKKKD